jgi:hypothetical protein
MGSNHMNDQFSNQKQEAENRKRVKKYIKYAKNPAEFMTKFWFGFNVFNSHKMEPLKPFKYQIEMLNTFHEQKYNLITNTRQMGVTSVVAIYIAWYILFHNDKHVMVITHNSDAASRFLEQVKTILEQCSKEGLCNWVEDITTNNKRELKLKNGSFVQARPATVDACRGYSLDLLYIDQAAYMKDFETIWTATGVALNHNNGKVIITSSPNDNSHFNKMAIDAATSNSSFKLSIYHWSKNPHYNKDITTLPDSPDGFLCTSPWYEAQKKMLGYNKKLIESELECVLNYSDGVTAPKDKTISLRMDQETYKKIQIKLHPKESVSDYIRRLIDADLK